MKKGLMSVVLLIDESGSMSGQRDETITGINKFIQTQKESGADILLSIVKFNYKPEFVFYQKPISEVKEITLEDYSPNGGTALYWSLGSAIEKLGKDLSKQLDLDRPEKVLFAVFSDGEDNVRKQGYLQGDVKNSVLHQESKYNWEFVYFGADLDAKKEGSKLGLSARRTRGHKKGLGQTVRAYDDLSFVTQSVMKNQDYNLGEII